MTFTSAFIDFFSVLYAYDVSFSILGLKKAKLPDAHKIPPNTTSYTILIPCHNEEEVIQKNLEAIYNCDYDKALLNVVVIADNCNDSTVEVCNIFKKKNPDFNCTILEVQGGSKPKAINTAVKLMKKQGIWNNDAIFMLDSDNHVHRTIFKSFNYYHLKGEKILQARIRSLNDQTYVSKGFASAFNSLAFGLQLAKNRLGLSGSLCGTGFSISRDVFDEVGFENCDTLTEDLEFSILAILKGYKVKYIAEEYVLNQNLDELKPSIIQRSRSCKGHMQVSIKLSWKVLKAFFKKPSLQLFDSFIFINTPSRTVLFALAFILSIIFYTPSIKILIIIFIVILIYNLVFTFKCDNYKITYLIPHYIYEVFMFFIIIYSAFTYKNKTWVKTEHRQVIEHHESFDK